jgi:DNA-binding beta-propeller fold protein YncE
MIQDQIKKMRITINSHLDKLEQDILQELDDTADKLKSIIYQLLEQLSENSKTVEGLQSDIIALKEYASDLQTFLGSKAIEKEVKKKEDYLKSLYKEECLQQLNLRHNINTKMKDILSTIATFGSVSVETSPPSVVIKSRKDKQAQLMTVMQHTSVKSINDVKLTFHTTFNIPKGKYNIEIGGCIVCPNGKMIFVDFKDSRLVILNEDGTLDKVITCSLGYLFDVTCLDDTTVAVSTSNGIEIIDVESPETERHIKTSNPCNGITHHNGALVWCEHQSGIQMMKLSDDRVTTFVMQSNLPYGSYIAAYGENIYQTNRDTSTVTCYTIKGEKLWEFKDVLVLKDPRGVTVDKNFNVYVTSYRSNKVVVLGPDGRQGRQLISRSDGLISPTGIYFDKSKNIMLVVNINGPAFLYEMR